MPFSDTSYNLRIELDTHECELSDAEIRSLEPALDPLRKPVEKFPVSDLYITVTFNSRSQDYRVKTALVLPKRTLTTADVDQQVYTALERCVRKLLRRIDAYQESLEGAAEQAKQQKGTHQEVIPNREPDLETLVKAVRERDYAAFRVATFVYEEPVRKRIGRWVARYPEVEARIGEDLKVGDMVEEVFLNAFERYDERQEEVRFGQWLEQLIDPSIKLLAEHPREELENIRFARTLRETDTG